MRKWITVSVTAAAAALLIAASAWAAEGYAVRAEKEDAAGTALDSGFFISGADSAQEIRNGLTIIPETRFTVRQAGEEFLIVPGGGLEPLTVYTLKMNGGADGAWAFQTKDIFRVTRTLPDSDGWYAPVKAGIELYFSQPVDCEDVYRHLDIVPETGGSVAQIDENTVVFMPYDGLEYDTRYRVTVNGGLTALSADELGADYTFRFTTESAKDADTGAKLQLYDSLQETYTAADPVVIGLYAPEAYEDVLADVTLYRYPSIDTYLEDIKTYDEQGGVLDTEKLEPAGNFQAALNNPNNYYYRLFLTFPENPGPGLYLAEIAAMPKEASGEAESRESRVQKLVQVTDISVYSQSYDGKALFWLNDAVTGEALEGAEITYGGKTAETDGEGIAVIDIGRIPEAYSLERMYHLDGSFYYPLETRITHEDRVFADFIGALEKRERTARDDYYAYVYTDREAYMPTDTVRFYGYITPRSASYDMPESLVLDWTDGGRYPEGIEIAVGEGGAFQGEIGFTDHITRWMSVPLLLDGEEAAAMSFVIMDYEKPVYTMDITVDKPYYRSGESLEASLNVNFYDGSPAGDVEVRVNLDANNAVMTTEADGTAQAVFGLQPENRMLPYNKWLHASVEGQEDVYVYESAFAQYYPRDYVMDASAFNEDGKAGLTVNTYNIDFDKAETGEYFKSYDEAELYGEPAEMTGEAALYRVDYIKYPDGQYYDFINKQTVDRYRYEREEKQVAEFTITAEDGVYSAELFDYPEEDNEVYGYYYLRIIMACPDGETLEESVTVPGGNDYSYYYSNPVYRFVSPASGAGETARIELSDSMGGSPETGRFLYALVGDGVLDAGTEEAAAGGSGVELVFKPEYAPGVSVAGAYFDGRHVYPVSELNYGMGMSSWNYDTEDSRLNITIKPDKERYAPGGEVTLDIEITDNDGEPAAASFILSAADEAAFAVIDQNVNPLREMYPYKYRYYLQYASYNDIYNSLGGAEAGDSGGDNARREFVDTAAFIPGVSGEDGKARVTFKLPDNLTSWRLTALAFADGYIGETNLPFTGNARENIAAGLPFFINEVLNAEYLSGDTIGLSIRSAGSAARGGDVVLYTARLTGKDVDDSLRARAGSYAYFTFDPLPPGVYKVLITATMGEYKDAIEKEITVADTFMVTERHMSGDLKDGINLSSRRFPVEMIMYDRENALFYDIIYDLLTAYANRADRKIARAAAGEKMNALGGEHRYSGYDGINEWGEWSANGVRLFVYGRYDPVLTAKAIMAAPEMFNADAVIYLRNVIDDENSGYRDRAAAYMALAALREPILPELRAAFTESLDRGGYGLEETVFLATGLALLGDTAPALEWYDEELRGYIVTDYDYPRLVNGDGEAYNYRLTAGAAVLAAVLGHADHTGLMSYIYRYRSDMYLPHLELAVYVGAHTPGIGGTARFSYELNGETVTEDFGKKAYIYLELGREQMEEADFTVLEGDVGYTAYYAGEPDSGGEPPEGVSVVTSINAPDADVGDTVSFETTVTFAEDSQTGYFEIIQSVPSGLRFTGAKLLNFEGIGFGDYYGSGYYYAESLGYVRFSYYVDDYELIHFLIGPSVYNDDRMPDAVTFRLDARAVLPGDYVAEGAAYGFEGGESLYINDGAGLTIRQ
jgi:hypothetical protein